MLPAGAESKHTAIPAHACVQTGKPKQEKRKEVVGIQEEGQDYSQEGKKRRIRLVSSVGSELLIYIYGLLFGTISNFCNFNVVEKMLLVSLHQQGQ